MVFLERDIKARKQQFGIEIYDILVQNSTVTTTASATISATQIQEAFEICQADIKALEAKVNRKREEMEAIDRSSGINNAAGDGGGHTNLGERVSVSSGGGVVDMECGIPQSH